MFISFEGSEGVGKSTLVAGLTAWLQEQQKDVINTREPGGNELAEKIRNLILHEDMHPSTELLLMFASRSEHIQKVIEPALKQGKWVLCDRFVDASFAYQGGGRGINNDTIELLQKQFVTTMPVITFWLDAPVEIGLSRVAKRDTTDRFEQQKVDFFKKIQSAYAQQHQKYPQRFKRIDATQNAEEVLQECKNYLEQYL